MSYKKYLFVDRDGTIIEEPSDFQIDSLEKIRFLDHVIISLKNLQKHGYHFVMASNQDGLGTDSFPQKHFDIAHKFIVDTLKSQGINFEEILICPHFEKDNCLCRKPHLGLLSSYLKRQDIDWNHSYVIGDRETDMTLAKNMGIAGYLIGPKSWNWQSLEEDLLNKPRKSSISRKTSETDIFVEVNLDSTRPSQISTGIGMFDHMLEQLAKHSGICMTIQCKGDLEIDSHHSIEDTAIVLGTCIKQALGEKIGIERYGYVLPMDEAQCQVCIDLCNRPFFTLEGSWSTTYFGDLSLEMVKHFFQSFAQNLGANIHMSVKGENGHHMVEALFKTLGRSLKKAIVKKLTGELASTKGIL